MAVTYTHLKNSNSGEILKRQHFYDISFVCPDYFYNWQGEEVSSPDLTGFVEISEKKFNREVKRKKQSLKR